MENRIPFTYSFNVLIQPDLYELNVDEAKLRIELTHPVSDADYAALESVFDTFETFFNSGALSNGEAESACSAYDSKTLGNESHWSVDMTPLTQGAVTVLLNLLQETQGKLLIKTVAITSLQPTTQPIAVNVCSSAQSAYLPVPENPPFEIAVEDIYDSIDLYIRFERELNEEEKEQVDGTLSMWFMGFDQGAYRLDAEGADDYGMDEEIVCVDDEAQWQITRLRVNQGAAISFVHIGLYLHQNVAPITELFVES